jgi:WD40 repeat protein
MDNTVRLWDIAAKREIARLEGHMLYVNSVAFSPDDRTLASAGWDGTVRLWNLILRQEVATLRGHKASVACVAFSPNGDLLISAGADARVRLWQAPPLNHFNLP